MSGESFAEFLLNTLTKNKAVTISFSSYMGTLRTDYTRGERHRAYVISPPEIKRLKFPDEALKVIISRMIEEDRK